MQFEIKTVKEQLAGKKLIGYLVTIEKERWIKDGTKITSISEEVNVPIVDGMVYFDGLREWLGKNAPEPFMSEDEKTEKLVNDRYSRLEQIWNKKTLGLKSIAIDKPYMKDAEAINNQYRVYEEMYKNAKNSLYDEATNTAIITANETVKTQLAPLTLLLNSVRGVLEALIVSNAENVDEMLDVAEAITLTKEELTAEKLGEIMTVFGL